MDFRTKIQDVLQTFKIEYDGWLPAFEQIVNKQISPLEFYREYVSKNIPVLIKGGASHLTAVGKWNAQYFRETIPEKNVTVAVTPNGYADGILCRDGADFFVKPEEVDMTMSEFLDHLDKPKDNYVCYIQKQNSNLTEDFAELVGDVGDDIPWATEALGAKPDAVNFWMGDARAVTSMHKDPYENIYCVVDGHKDFILLPPTELPNVYYQQYQIATYKNVTANSYSLDLEMKNNNFLKVPWVSVDPLKPDLDKYPKFQNCFQYEFRVAKGDCLYIPHFWFHHVRQSHGCVAVNYWYDMEYDNKYYYHQLYENLCTDFK